jgi:stage IV sporulation protein FB
MGVWRFSLLGFPVVVEPFFWLVILLLGAQRPPILLPSWILAAFLSIVVHELGHAYLGRLYGFDAWIRLYSFGGLTFYEGDGRTTLLRRALLSLAGPMAGFAFGLVVWALAPLVPRELWYLRVFLADLVYVNIAWGLVNLLPVLPLDGGNVMRQIVYWWTGRSNDALPLRISLGTAALVVVAALARNSLYTAALFGFMAYENYQNLQRHPRSRSYR